METLLKWQEEIVKAVSKLTTTELLTMLCDFLFCAEPDGRDQWEARYMKDELRKRIETLLAMVAR